MPPAREFRRFVPLLAQDASYLAASARSASFVASVIPMFKRTVLQPGTGRNDFVRNFDFVTVFSRDPETTSEPNRNRGNEEQKAAMEEENAVQKQADEIDAEEQGEGEKIG